MLVIDRALDRDGSIALRNVSEMLCNNDALAWIHGVKPWRVACLISTAARMGAFASYGIALRRGAGFVRCWDEEKVDVAA